MRTIGKFLKEERTKKHYSQSLLEEKTRIKKVFLDALEKEHWSILPEFAVVVGFVKNVSIALDIDTAQAVAMLRRDYPPKQKTGLTPKPDIKRIIGWRPRYTFFVLILTIFLLVSGYLYFQFRKFNNPPSLVITSPTQQEIIKTSTITVSGSTDTDSSVIVNNQPVIVDDKGNFAADIEIFEGTREIVVKSTTRAGKAAVVRISIKPELAK